MNRVPRITGIVLAAGTGSRMGRTKQLLPFRGQALLECVVGNARASSLDRIIVVLGFQADAVAQLFAANDVTVVVNPAYESGQSTSLKAGLHAVTQEADAVLFLLGDQPLVTPETINRIISHYERFPHCPVVVPVFEGRRGNPALFSRETFARIEALSGDCGARSLFAEYAGNILEVTVNDRSIHMDIDTEEDYHRLLEHEDHAGT
ncbi:MAG TPA: molybdenum cofactor cytidylyltransferase [Desulfuromonadales bacterium]|nr:molybdenum cofactor cytidylyltransferase [Desulfuromonadales bacterium]